MNHRLRPLFRFHTDMGYGLIELHGCLTAPATGALLRLLIRSKALSHTTSLGLDLRPARHIDPDALRSLRLPAITADGTNAPDVYEVKALLETVGSVMVLLPSALPVCPAKRALGGRSSASYSGARA